MRYLLHQLLEESAARFPDRIAVRDQGKSISYRELDQRSNQLARLFLAEGVSGGNRIGLFLDKSIDAVIAIYGILKAGAAYVPLDPRAPAARVGYIASDCGLSWLISGGRQIGKLAELIEAGAKLEHVVTLADTSPLADSQLRHWRADDLDGHPFHPLLRSGIDQNLAYILYTSGSTGQPKGVMLTHRNALGFVEWTVEELGITHVDRLSSHAPFHFDLSIFDLFAAAAAGASVSLVPTVTSVFPVEVAKFIEGERISLWYSVPSILSLLSQHGDLEAGALPELRAMVFAGEVFPSKYLARLMDQLPHVAFHNWYGPTETNVCTAFHVEAPPDPAGPDIPIGRAIKNVETIVVAADGRRAATDEVGELYVRGATVMSGYWADPDKTASRLVPNPIDPASPDLCYRTGDLVAEQEDGNYRFFGRRDHQIKSRGYRIELGEIETALNSHPAVMECAVVAVPDDVISNRLLAHVVVEGAADQNDLIAWCASLIPRYMIPESFLFSEELPKTSTG
ncbi:MAG: amino acid adenylation domain-containing protein [Acidimicrobiia bacterium]